jgi:hypothetical protein
VGGSRLNGNFRLKAEATGNGAKARTSDETRSPASARGTEVTTDLPGLIAPAWCDRPMRWAQLTLVENDPGRFDPQFWLDYFRRIHADAACLSAGGIVAYYPTAVPLHHRSAWLGTSDPFGTLVEGCRTLGMHVIARTDPHAARDEVQRAHPDWIAVTADGKPRRHWANPELWVTCALGPYNFEFMTAVHREIVSRYRVDGIFSNRWAGHGQCWCEHCRANFRAATGLELPSSQDPKDRTRREYILWNRERLTMLWKHWDAEIRTINADACFIPNGPPDLRTAGELAPIQFADHQARRGLTPPWANARRAKEYRSVMGRRPVGGIFSVGLEEPWRWKDSVQADAEVRIWAAEGTAAGMRPWFTKFSGVLYDRRWLATVERIYGWHHRNERYLRNERSLARVAMLVSEQTATFHGGAPHQERHGDHASGMYHALVEARIPFDMVHEAYLTPERIDRYRVLVLANAAALSDAQCAALAGYVERGGRLVATFETSLYDERGRRRKDFGLADLFGVSIDGDVEGPMHNSYLALEPDPETSNQAPGTEPGTEPGTRNREPGTRRRYPLLAGLEDAPRIINGVWRLRVTPRGTFPSPITVIPSYPDLPMEDVYPRVAKTDERGVYLREAGRGRVVYFPWDIDRTFNEVLNPDHGRVLANAIRWAADEAPIVSVAGPGVVDVAVWRQQSSMTLHLVNLTNPMMMKGPFRELLPIGPLDVRVRVPASARADGVRLLTANSTPAVRREADGTLLVTVPEVLDHEVVALEL